MELIRLIVIDDHSVVRRGLRRYMELFPDLEIAAEAANGLDGLAMAVSVAHDLILLDMALPDMDGIATTGALKALVPTTPIIIFTSACEQATLLAALRAGVQGFLLKDVGADELALAIRTVHAGHPYLQPYVASLLINSTLQQPRHEARLTGREQQIYDLLTCGLSNRQIAAELRISEKTASVHVSNLISKLGLRNRTEVALYALQSTR